MVIAPDFGKDLEEFETFIQEATKVLQEGRRAGATHFYVGADLNMELGSLCTGDEDHQELREVY